jgi:hypothetical protein
VELRLEIPGDHANLTFPWIAKKPVTFFNLVPALSPGERSNHVSSSFNASRNRVSAAVAGLGVHSNFQIDLVAARDGRLVSGAAQTISTRYGVARRRRAAVDT